MTIQCLVYVLSMYCLCLFSRLVYVSNMSFILSVIIVSKTYIRLLWIWDFTVFCLCIVLCFVCVSSHVLSMSQICLLSCLSCLCLGCVFIVLSVYCFLSLSYLCLVLSMFTLYMSYLCLVLSIPCLMSSIWCICLV